MSKKARYSKRILGGAGVGVLYDVVMKKRQIIIEELHKLNVYKSQDNQDLENLTYDDLKHELVLASFRKIEIDHPSHKFF